MLKGHCSCLRKRGRSSGKLCGWNLERMGGESFWALSSTGSIKLRHNRVGSSVTKTETLLWILPREKPGRRNGGAGKNLMCQRYVCMYQSKMDNDSFLMTIDLDVFLPQVRCTQRSGTCPLSVCACCPESRQWLLLGKGKVWRFNEPNTLGSACLMRSRARHGH